MTPTAHEMGELAGELMTLLVFKKETATVEDFCKVITKHWTAFATAREQAVWEEAAKICDLKVCSCKERGWDPKEKCFIHKVLCPQGELAREFRRLATQVEGREVE